MLNTRRGELCQMGLSPDAKPVERHQFLLGNRCAIFDVLTFSILNPMAGPPSLSAHPYGILIPVVAHQGRYEASKLAQTWILDVVAATSLSPGFRPTEKEAWHLHRDASVAVAVEWVGTEWDAGNGLSDWSDRYAGWIDGWMAVA